MAEYYNEAGSQAYLSSVQTSATEFDQILKEDNIETSDRPDSLGVNEVLGTSHVKVTKKLKFENNHFTFTKTDSTFSLEKVKD